MATLNTVKDYHDQVLKPNYNDFMTGPSTFQGAINVATSLYHMHEWMFALEKARLETLWSVTLNNVWEVWAYLEGKVPEAGSIRDVANASKHVELTRNPSTSMTHIANTHIVPSSYGVGGYGTGRYAGPSVIMDQNGAQIPFDDCATKVFRFWDALVMAL